MKDKVKQVPVKFKEFWNKLGKGIRTIIIIALSAVMIAAIAFAIVLNIKASEWVVLFPDMTAEESTQVYQELQAMEVETKINSNGEIEVRKTEWDDLVYKLAEKGYPQSAPSYGTFFDNLSMTMSEFEKKQTLRFELQDRIQTTLKRIEGVKGAIVTISFPETTNYVWKENNEKATASVMLTLENPKKFTYDQIRAVKNIVAYSAQKIEPDNVTVVDASTGKELLVMDPNTTSDASEERMTYLSLIKNQYEENAIKILAPTYGVDGVTAVASVTLDYDKITQEMKELITNGNGEGVKENEHIQYKTNDTVDNGGVVGEEQNSDIPNYGNLEDNLNSDDTPYYERDTDWATGYILTQTEKAQGAIADASISVVVATESGTLTEEERDSITQLVKNATNIDARKVSVAARPLIVSDEEEQSASGVKGITDIFKQKMFLWLLIAGLIFLIALVILIIVLVNARAKKKIAEAQAERDREIENMKMQLAAEEAAAAADSMASMFDSNGFRKSIEEAAREHSESNGTTEQDVRDFASRNPEIAAALIRSLMRE